MKIELKGVKHAKFASQETECFEATVYINGKKAGVVSNEGHGGDNRYFPDSLGATLTEYAKTLPPLTTQYGTLAMDADLVIGRLFEAWQAEKHIARLMKNHIVFVRDGKLYQSRKDVPLVIETILRNPVDFIKERYKADVVLNKLPLEKAVTTYLETAVKA